MAEKRLRILHVIAHMEKGGAERRMCLLIGASRHDHVVAVLAGNEKDGVAPVVTLPDLGFWKNVRRLRAAIRHHRIDILQAWVPERLTFPATLAARLEGVRVLAMDTRKPRNYGRFMVRDRLYYLAFLFSDRISPNYPILPKLVSLARMLGLRRRTRFIPNGVPRRGAPVPLTGVPDRLLFVGRLVEQKRVDIMIRTLRRLHDAQGIAGVDIVGEGPERGALEALVGAERVGDLVTFHGPRFDWSTHFDPSTHALVLPSASEGMSNTLFEAIDFGFFPITTDSPEVRYLLNPFSALPGLFELDDQVAFIDAVAEMRGLAHPELQKRLDALREGLSHYSVAAFAQRFDRLYEEMT